MHKSIRTVMRLGYHLHHWLVPHRRNNHRPHLIRAHGLAAVVGLLVLLQGIGYAAAPAYSRHTPVQGAVLGYATDINPIELLKDTNIERQKAGLAPLVLDSRLNSSAGLKAANMFQEDYWAHVSPSGIQPWYWFGQAGYSYSYAGENLAKDFDTSSGAMAGWMNSPGHRANILNANYTNVGFAVVNGTLTGGQTTLVVAHYGRPASAGVLAASSSTIPTPAPQPTKGALASPVPTIVASPTTQSPVPVVAASTPTTAPEVLPPTMLAPAAKSYGLVHGLALTQTLPWATWLSLLVLLILLLVYAATHITTWYKSLKAWHIPGYRLRAAGQLVGLTALIVFVASAGFGRVG